ELCSVPGGHFLVANAAVAPSGAAATAASVVKRGALKNVPGHATVMFHEPAAKAAGDSGLPPLALGPVMVEFDPANELASLDMSTAIPEYTLNGEKYNLGTIELGVSSGGSFYKICSIRPTDYNRVRYLAKSGIVDARFEGVTWSQIQQWLQYGVLALQVQQDGAPVLASLEFPLTAETDDRGTYLDQCRTESLTIQVRYKNGAPPPGTKIRL